MSKSISTETKIIQSDNICNIYECKNEKLGSFYECKKHFDERHKHSKFKWTPKEEGYKTITTILKCYPNIYDIGKIDIDSINNGQSSKIRLKCDLCKYGYEWNIKIDKLIKNGSSCLICEINTKEGKEKHIKKLVDIRFDNSEPEKILLCVICGYKFGIPEIILTNSLFCPKCPKNSPKAIKIICAYFSKLNVKYVLEKTFDGMKNKSPLRIDIYVEKYPGISLPICIEYVGNCPESRFHYENDSVEKHELSIQNNKIKSNFVIRNNMHLLRIHYTCYNFCKENNIYVLSRFLTCGLNVLKIMKNPFEYIIDSLKYEKFDDKIFEKVEIPLENISFENGFSNLHLSDP